MPCKLYSYIVKLYLLLNIISNNPNENVIKSLHLLMQGKPKEESPSNKDGKDSKDSKLITFQNQPSLSISKKNNDKNDKISFEKEHIASDDDDHLGNI